MNKDSIPTEGRQGGPEQSSSLQGNGNGRSIDFGAIRDRVDFRALVERELGVQLRAGRCTCPFHSGADNPTSFFVDGPRAKCFACDWKGDVLDFLAKHRGITLREAAEAIDPALGSNGKTATRPAKGRSKGGGL